MLLMLGSSTVSACACAASCCLILHQSDRVSGRAQPPLTASCLAAEMTLTGCCFVHKLQPVAGTLQLSLEDKQTASLGLCTPER